MSGNDVSVWERFSREDGNGVLPAPRTATAAPTTPSARLLQVEQELVLAKTYLRDAVQTISRMRERDSLLHDFETSLAGIPCSQYWVDLLLWEGVLNSHPELLSICELGTGNGGFSWYLWMQAKARSLRFRTYDTMTSPVFVPEFFHADVFLDQKTILEWIGSEPTALFCDNGNKPRELNEYAPLLPTGSIVVVHDWDVEIGEDDIPEWMEEIHGDFCDMLDSATRVFKRKEA